MTEEVFMNGSSGWYYCLLAYLYYCKSFVPNIGRKQYKFKIKQ